MFKENGCHLYAQSLYENRIPTVLIVKKKNITQRFWLQVLYIATNLTLILRVAGIEGDTHTSPNEL